MLTPRSRTPILLPFLTGNFPENSTEVSGENRSAQLLGAVASGAHLRVAATAIDRPVLAGNERHLSSLTTTGTNGIVHGPLVSARATTSLLRTAGLPASRAALGVLIAPAGMELLIIRREDELFTAISTRQRDILVCHQ